MLDSYLVPGSLPAILLASLVTLTVAGCDGDDDGGNDSVACSDMLDNDNDGFTDFPQDPGCSAADDDNESNPPLPVCSDRIDNDGDGRVDYPVDPGCFNPLANDERDNCPSDPLCPQCANLVDDDGDGLLDYPNDPDCGSAVDDDEFDDSLACQSALTVIDVNAPATVTGTAMSGQGSLASSPICGGGGKEIVYRLVLTEPRMLVATTDFAETTLDTVLYLRSSCADVNAELACNDDLVDAMPIGPSRIQANLEPGAYYLFADAKEPTSSGEYRLQIDTYVPGGGPCDPEIPGLCAPGFECNPDAGSPTGHSCRAPACRDGEDNDGDGRVDHPAEPGCLDPDDNDETDDCPAGPNCPECANGEDDDLDGTMDYPADSGCFTASDDTEALCEASTEPVGLVTVFTTGGTTSGASDDFTPSCGGTFGPDHTFALNVTAPLTTLTMDTNGSGFDTVLTFTGGTCTSMELGCDDDGGDSPDSLIESTSIDPGLYYITVDGYLGSNGSYLLNVHGVIEDGGFCDPALIASGLFSCSPSHACDGTVCAPAACSNTADDDMDGLTDYPEDPGCASGGDGDESDDCPTGPMCPECGNEEDDDGDGAIDYPADLGCSSAADGTEIGCTGSSEPLVVIDNPVITGSTAGATDDFAPSCNFSTAPEIAHVMRLPGALATLRVDTLGSSYDTILHVRLDDCSGAEYACNDDTLVNTQSELDLIDVPAGIMFILVDGYSSNSGPYTLNVSGQIRAGESCDSPLVAQGVLSCESGYSCDGSICTI